MTIARAPKFKCQSNGSSLAHPGGNITGFTAFEFATSAKWLELIKEIAPELRSLVQSDPR